MDYRSSLTSVGGSAKRPDYLYYNADIINNETRDQSDQSVVVDPQIRFNETRDTALISNAQDYYFSIVRFTMNGANLDLPLFIPSIQQSTGANNINNTVYSAAISLEQTYTILTGAGNVDVPFTIIPPQRFVQYVPETKNLDLAPIPRSMVAANYKGIYNAGTTYQLDDIVSATPNDQYGNGTAPFYAVRQQSPWSPQTAYAVGAAVIYNKQLYVANAVPPVGVVPPSSAAWTAGLLGFSPLLAPQYWIVVSSALGTPQDLSSRYYWVYTYQHWVDLVNQTIINDSCLPLAPNAPLPPGATACIYKDLYDAFATAWAAVPGNLSPFPFPTLQDFANYVNAPQIVFNPSNKFFSIYFDSDGFGKRIQPFTAAVPPAAIPQKTPPKLRLFFNSNTYGLFTNFSNLYWNNPSPVNGPFPGFVAPLGYTNEILVPNKYWTNVVDYRLPPYSSGGAPPLGYVPPAGFNTAAVQQKPYWVITQDYPSIDCLWSPISSIVFTSTLLPVRSEAQGQPLLLGNSDLGFSAPTSQSAFQPIITDISLDQGVDGADAYRQFIFYAPAAEYRLSDFTGTATDVRNIDVQVFWKNRLDDNLYPIYMFNLSSVSLKLMFRHKDAVYGAK